MKRTSVCRHKAAAAPGGGEAGFSIIEILFALVISTVLVVGMYQSLTTMQRWWRTVSSKSDMSQNARAGLETFTRDLEMAGYQTTKYGDVKKSGLAVTLADTDEIEVDQQRLDIATGTYVPRLVYYHVRTDVTTGRQNLYRQIRTTPGVPSETGDEIVAENVASFNLSYFGCDQLPPACKNADTPLNSALPQQYQVGVDPPSMLKRIRRVQVSITTTTPKTYIGTATKPVTLTASVSPQNLASNETIIDTSVPAVPSGVAVIDNRSCTQKLQVKWNKNTEPDLAGYVITFAPGKEMTVPLAAVISQAGTTISYALNSTDVLITKNVDRATASNKYNIELQAYDSSGNYSARSAVVSGPTDPMTDVTAFGTPNNDSTVNPLKPSPPGSLTVDGTTTGKLVLSWPVSISATVGYRLYRSESPFPVGAGATISPSSTITLLKDETFLTKTVTTYEDQGHELPGGELLSCMDYYYAIASVNCDESLVATYRNPAVGSDYALASGQFMDETPPPPPSLAGTVAGWKRIFVTLLNPTTEQCEDFDRTEVWFNKGLVGGPELTGTSVTGAPTPLKIPNSDNGTTGTFVNRGNETTVFASESDPTTYTSTPTLENEIQYNLFAVSYDRCGNASAGAGSSKTIVMCGDDSVGPPPGSPTDPTYTSCQLDTVELGWSYDYKDTLLDFAGYHIERTGPSSFTEELTSGPTWYESWVDSGELQAGGTYYYSIRATDCVFENKNAEFPFNRSLPLDIGPIYPGSLRKYVPPAAGDPLAAENFVTTTSDDPGTYTYHNNVNFSLQNTSAGTMTLAKMAVTWENPNVVLDKVTIGGSPAITPKRIIEPGVVTVVTQVDSHTTLAAAATMGDATITVGSTAGFTSPILLSIGGNVVACAGVEPTEFTGCTWPGGATVYPVGHPVANATRPAATSFSAAPLTGAATITVIGTAGFLPAGKIAFDGNLVTYSSLDANNFYGCSWSAYSADAGTAVRTANGETVLTTLAAAAGSGAADIAVDSTAGFPASGQITIDGRLITFAGTTPTSLSGCTWVSSSGGVASGVPFAIYVQIKDTANGTNTPSIAIPVQLRFSTPGGGVNRLTDMRSEDVELSLWVDNDSLQQSNCIDPDLVLIKVPKGPVLGGFAQDRTALDIVASYVVVGETGTARDADLQVPGGFNVNVYGTVFDNSGDLFADGIDRGFATGYPKLVGATADAADAGVVPIMPASNFTRALYSTAGENYAIYKTIPVVTGARMPSVSEQVNWYYGLVVDVTGNWDREPNPDIGNFAYYQLSNVSCSAPNPPSPLQVMSTGHTRPELDTAVLTWTRPSQYIDGTSIAGGTTILYDVYRNSNGVPPFDDLIATNLTDTSWTYTTADMLTSASYFVVVAKNDCATHNASDISNVGRECVGAGAVYCSMFDIPSSATIDVPFTVGLSNACLYTNGNTTDKVNFFVDGSGTDKYILAGEASDGNFSTTITAKSSATSNPNEVQGTTSFTINLWTNGSPKTQLPAAPAAQCQKTVALVASGCSTYPSRPSPVNSRSMARDKATVTWGASTSTPDALGGYEVAYQYQPCTNYRSGRCRNWGTLVNYGASTAVAAGTTTYTYTYDNSLVTRYKFRVRSKDTCTTGPNYSSWVETRDWLQVNP